jgi:hypothetical protein
VACEALGNFAFRNPGCGLAVAGAGTAPTLLAGLARHSSDARVAESALFALSALPAGALPLEVAGAACAAAEGAVVAHPGAKRLQRWARDVRGVHGPRPDVGDGVVAVVVGARAEVVGDTARGRTSSCSAAGGGGGAEGAGAGVGTACVLADRGPS